MFFPVRYADDFVIIVSGSRAEAIAEKTALAEYLRRTTGLQLSPEKTKITTLTEGFEFLGFKVSLRWMGSTLRVLPAYRGAQSESR